MARKVKKNRRGLAHGGLIAVALVMVAAIAGAFSAMYYTWTVPFRIEPLTFTFTLAEEPLSGATIGVIRYGEHATIASAAVPAQGAGGLARITLQEKSKVTFRITSANADNLNAGFYYLAINICMYKSGDNLAVTPDFDSLYLFPVVADVAAGSIENTTAYRAAGTYDVVITVAFITDNVTTTQFPAVKLEIYATEADA